MSENTPIVTYCANHPKVETSLRCNRCEKPICVKCAVKTPTGYRCKECVNSQQKKFDTSEWYDYTFGFLTASVLSAIASLIFLLISNIGLFGWFIAAAAAPTAGLIIAEAARFATRRHRSKALYMTILAGVVAGALPAILFSLLIFNFYGLIFEGIYLVLVVPSVYYRISGIQLFK